MNSSLLSTRLLGLLTLSLVATSVAAQSLLPTQGQVVAELNDAPAGLLAGEVLGTTTPTDTPVMDRNGAILFRGAISGGTSTTLNNRALFFGHTKADLKVLVRAGDVDPSGTYPNSVLEQMSGGTGLPLGSNIFSLQRISPRGEFILFGAQLYNPTAIDPIVHIGAGQNHGLLYWGPASGPLMIMAQQNTTVMPGGATLVAPPVSISHQQTALNSSGTGIFQCGLVGGDVVGTTNDTAWVIGTYPGPLAYFVRENDSFLGGQVVIGAGNLGFNCVLNEAGQILHDERFSQTLGSTPATAANDQVAFISTPSGLGWQHDLLMREGDTAPDAAGAPMAGITYGAPTMGQGFTNAGTASFATAMTGAVTAADDGAIFIGGIGAGSVKLAAREGDAIDGENVGVINSTFAYSAAGAVAGSTLVQPGNGGVTNTNDSILFLANPGMPLVKIAREGDACPGLPGYVFGNITGSSNFGSASNHRINERGCVMFSQTCNNGVNQPTLLYSWDALHGLQLQMVAGGTIGDVMGGGTVSVVPTPIVSPNGDGNALSFNSSGDFVISPNITTPSGKFVVRGHCGSLQGTPSAIDVNGGSHFFAIDCTPAHAFSFYLVMATGLGTDSPYPHPLNPSIPGSLNFDLTWTNLSFDLLNSPVWSNTLWITDAAGKATAAFNMPPGYPGFQGTTLHHAAFLFDFSLLGTFVTEPVPCHLY